MDAQRAFDSLDPDAWANANATKRSSLVKELRFNLLAFAEELGRKDAAMKNGLTGNGGVSGAEGICHHR